MELVGLGILLVAMMAAVTAIFIKGSRPVQPLDTEHADSSRPFANALIAIFSPVIAVVIFYVGVWSHFTNNRVFDLLIALPLVNGAYCGRRAFRSTLARVPVRTLALIAMIVCIPGAIVFLFITIFGVC